MGYSLHKACILGLTPYRTVKDYYDQDEDFRKKIIREMNFVSTLARRNWIKMIKIGDYKASVDWLRHREGDEFNTKQTIGYDPEEEIQRILKLIKENVPEDNKQNQAA